MAQQPQQPPQNRTNSGLKELGKGAKAIGGAAADIFTFTGKGALKTAGGARSVGDKILGGFGKFAQNHPRIALVAVVYASLKVIGKIRDVYKSKKEQEALPQGQINQGMPNYGNAQTFSPAVVEHEGAHYNMEQSPNWGERIRAERAAQTTLTR